MRFKETSFYTIDELQLDQENYRFGLAKNQEECIELIYKDSPESFENLLEDMVNNNIGDYPLVFINPKNEKIVLDGNRRISILKIINDPSLSPSKKISDLLASLDKNKLPFDLNNIGCFVSTNKQEILKTVYERHAAGKGISRIQWSAFATAKFRYDAEIEDNDWRAIAILLHIMSVDEDINILIKKPSFSFEVFRRMIRHAYLNGYLHFDIFNEDKNVLNPESNYLSSAIELIKNIVKAIDNNEVGLSRKKNYASEDFISQYFSHHFKKVTELKPPRRKRKNKKIEIQNPIIKDNVLINHSLNVEFPSQAQPFIAEARSNEDPFLARTAIDEDPFTNVSSILEPATIETTYTPINTLPQINLPLEEKFPVLDISEPASMIEKSSELINSLNKLSIQKFSLLYNSLAQLNIKKYPILAVIATWAFLDSLPRVTGWEGTDFSSYYNNHIKRLITTREAQTDIRHSISWLHSEGNCNKHSSNYITLDYKEFIKHFNNIQKFISLIIDQKILPNK